ncbi:MAG: hypothetical protein Q8P84_00950 [Deltaproteobacteria bacterium]|nr:hypothetical protein [Deltaproteobacteria bacterium]
MPLGFAPWIDFGAVASRGLYLLDTFSPSLGAPFEVRQVKEALRSGQIDFTLAQKNGDVRQLALSAERVAGSFSRALELFKQLPPDARGHCERLLAEAPSLPSSKQPKKSPTDWKKVWEKIETDIFRGMGRRTVSVSEALRIFGIPDSKENRVALVGYLRSTPSLDGAVHAVAGRTLLHFFHVENQNAFRERVEEILQKACQTGEKITRAQVLERALHQMGFLGPFPAIPAALDLKIGDVLRKNGALWERVAKTKNRPAPVSRPVPLSKGEWQSLRKTTLAILEEGLAHPNGLRVTKRELINRLASERKTSRIFKEKRVSAVEAMLQIVWQWVGPAYPTPRSRMLHFNLLQVLRQNGLSI